MRVSITDIDQSFSLASGKVTNYLVIELPSGKKVRAPVDDSVVEEIIASGGQVEQEAAPQAEPARTTPMGEDFMFGDQEATSSVQDTPVESLEQYERHVSSGAVEWEKLPDTQLPPQMKQILRASKINPIISIEDLDVLKAQILERLGKQAKPGKVDWNEGQRRQANSRPRRTVPMDEAGNPVPPGGIMESDPGEGPDDDDGVDQA